MEVCERIQSFVEAIATQPRRKVDSKPWTVLLEALEVCDQHRAKLKNLTQRQCDKFVVSLTWLKLDMKRYMKMYTMTQTGRMPNSKMIPKMNRCE